MVHILRQSIQIACYSLALLTLTLLPTRTLQAAEVITTLPPLSSLVHWLDPQASVICLLPASADPHHFQLTPRQVESMQKAKLLIRSSRDDGQWASLHTLGKTWDIWPSQAARVHKDKNQHEHHHEIGNHAWLNPYDVALILPQLAQQLIDIYPNHRQSIEKNVITAQKTIQALEQQWQRITSSQQLQSKGCIMQHPAWLNLFQDLHIPVWAVLESEKHGQEHGPHVLEDALKTIQQHPHSLLIANQRHNPRALLWLQRHHPQSQMITLDALGNSEDTWPQLMQRNLEIIQRR